MTRLAVTMDDLALAATPAVGLTPPTPPPATAATRADPTPGRIREKWRCPCGHAFTRDARVHHDHRDVQMEVSP